MVNNVKDYVVKDMHNYYLVFGNIYAEHGKFYKVINSGKHGS